MSLKIIIECDIQESKSCAKSLCYKTDNVNMVKMNAVLTQHFIFKSNTWQCPECQKVLIERLNHPKIDR